MQPNLDLNGFMKELERHFIDHPSLPARFPENRERLATLVENGIVFLPNYVARDTVGDLVNKIAWLPEALRDGRLEQLPERHKHAFPAWGLFRIYDVDRTYAEANVLKDDPIIADIVQSYLANHARHTTCCVELRDTPGDPESLPEHMMPHFDSYYREVKVWLLLIDVGMSQGPMRYYTKTWNLRVGARCRNTCAIWAASGATRTAFTPMRYRCCKSSRPNGSA